ncbi:MAG TPA: quinone oxidoreductase [Pseudonocardiaceae bacterium]
MRAIQVRAHGGPEVLTAADVAQPSAGPGRLLVRVTAAGVNYIDTYHREGAYPVPLPFTPGLEGAGVVEAVGEATGEDAGEDVGEDVGGFAVGDRVAWSDQLGSYAELASVAADRVVAVPDGVDDERACAAMLQGMTAHYLVTASHPVAAGETVLVHAAAGGMGLLLCQLVTARGGRVIGTTSTAEKAELARAAGAAEVIDYTAVPDLAAAVRELTGGEGVAAVYDGVGASTFDASLAALRRRGTLVLYGAASGPVPPVDPQRLNAAGSVFVTRPKLADHTVTREELTWRAGEILSAVARGTLDLRIGGRYPLAEAAAAHRDLQGRRTTGKLLLLP